MPTYNQPKLWEPACTIVAYWSRPTAVDVALWSSGQIIVRHKFWREHKKLSPSNRSFNALNRALQSRGYQLTFRAKEIQWSFPDTI